MARAPPGRQPEGTVQVIPETEPASLAGAGAGRAASALPPAGAGSGAAGAAAAGAPPSAAGAGTTERRHATNPSTRIATSRTPAIQRIMFGSFRSGWDGRRSIVGRGA